MTSIKKIDSGFQDLVFFNQTASLQHTSFIHQIRNCHCEGGIAKKASLYNSRHVNSKLQSFQKIMLMHHEGKFRNPCTARQYPAAPTCTPPTVHQSRCYPAPPQPSSSLLRSSRLPFPSLRLRGRVRLLTESSLRCRTLLRQDDVRCHELQFVCHCEVSHCKVEDEDATGGFFHGSL